MKQRKGLISPRHARPGRISKDYGVSVCWKGVREAEELWNTVSAILEDHDFVGCVPKSLNATNFRIRPRSGKATYQLGIVRLQSRSGKVLINRYSAHKMGSRFIHAVCTQRHNYYIRPKFASRSECHLFSFAVQFRTTDIGVPSACFVCVKIKNRCPSGRTS